MKTRTQHIHHTHRWAWLMVLAMLIIGLGHTSSAKANEPVDVMLLLDGSGSISPIDWQIQINGMVQAFSNSAIIPRDGTFAVAVVQYANNQTRVEVPYTLIASQADANAVIALVQNIQQMSGCTPVGAGVIHGISILQQSARPEASNNICLFTDGENNCGPGIPSAGNMQAAGVDLFGVLAMEDPPFYFEQDFVNIYSPFIFGGGQLTVVANAAAFANALGPTCFAPPAKLVGLEVIQSVQDWENSVGLVKDKTTYVRAHIEPLDPQANPEFVVAGRLRGFRNGQPLPGSPLTAINQPQGNVPAGMILVSDDAPSRRGNWNDSLNFRLPASWLHGEVQLLLEGGFECSEAAATNEDCELVNPVTFQEVPPMEVKFVGIRYNNSGGNEIAPADTSDLAGRLRAIFPISSVDASYGTTDMTSASNPPTGAEIISRLNSMRFWDFCWDVFGCNRYYYGVLHGSGGGRADGCPSSVSYGYLPPNNAMTYGYNRHAHELGHNLNYSHLGTGADPSDPGCLHAVPGCGIDLPFSTQNNRVTLGPMDQGLDKIVYGLDTKSATPLVIDPGHTFALMSYCGGTAPNTRRWVSKVVYDAIRGTLAVSPAYEPSPTPGGMFSRQSLGGNSDQTNARGDFPGNVNNVQVGGDVYYLVVSGIVDMVNEQVAFEPTISITTDVTLPTPPPGPYTLVALDENDNVIDEIPFDVQEIAPDCSVAGCRNHADSRERKAQLRALRSNLESGRPRLLTAIYNSHFGIAGDIDPDDPGDDGDPDGFGTFIVPVPDAEMVKKVQIHFGGNVIGSIEASDNAPVIDIIAPGDGDVLDGDTASFEWIASDADGDPLTYMVQISGDGGNTWETLVVNWNSMTLEVDMSLVPETDMGVVRVFASDGFNSTMAVSDGFFVTNKAPEITILSPADGHSFFGVQTIFFVADAFDVEDGPLTGNSIQWTSDIDGNIGSGEQFTLLAIDLTEGTHTITATATDSAGSQTSASVQIATDDVFEPEEELLLCGDLNDDGIVDSNDLVIFMNAYGSCVGDPAYDARADYDFSGCVGMADLATWYDHYLCFIDPECDLPEDCPAD